MCKELKGIAVVFISTNKKMAIALLDWQFTGKQQIYYPETCLPLEDE